MARGWSSLATLVNRTRTDDSVGGAAVVAAAARALVGAPAVAVVVLPLVLELEVVDVVAGATTRRGDELHDDAAARAANASASRVIRRRAPARPTTEHRCTPGASLPFMEKRDRLYIDGSWVPSTGKGAIDVIGASTEEVIGTVPEGTAADVDKAVAAAKAAFLAWSATPVEERAKYLQRLQEGLSARMGDIANVVTAEVGMPLNLSIMIQAGLPTMVMGSFAQIVGEFPFEEQIGNSVVVHEPIGVVGCITPWNYPLHQVVAKVAPAFAAGCTVVLKPSEVAPLSAFILAEVIDEVGLPAGVFNLVTGYGPVVGEAIAAHPDVDMVSFTGSTRAGKRVSELGAQTIKRVALELGGKSANIILDDADLEQAVTAGVNNAFLNSGQTCTAWTRMLVP